MSGNVFLSFDKEAIHQILIDALFHYVSSHLEPVAGRYNSSPPKTV